MSGAARYSFGPFELDTAARRLTKDGEPIPLADRHFEVLTQLVAQAGAILSKDMLVAGAWHDVAVTDNSLEQAISTLRRRLGPGPDGQPYIATVARQGYRFTGTVTQAVARESDTALEQLLAPHRAFLEGRSALETLERGHVDAAASAFRRALALSPEYAPAHLGLANALVFQFEATRADESPDITAIAAAAEHAQEACRLDSTSAEAWATLGFVLHRARKDAEALAAARRAVALEPGNWRHHLRLAFVSWGEERLRAAARTLELLPGLALAHWIAATVHVARQAFDAAERELDAGAVGQDQQRGTSMRFAAVGLHWLRGLVRLRRGDRAEAEAEFARELAFEDAGHVYARECCANTWYAIGGVALNSGQHERASEAFAEALARVPVHAGALAAWTSGSPAASVLARRGLLEHRLQMLRTHGAIVDAAVAEASARAVSGDHAAAAAAVEAALDQTPPGPAGWTIPVDPVLHVSAHPSHWARVLALLASRAA